MSFESIFFGPGNLLQWQKIVDRELPPSVLLKLDPFPPFPATGIRILTG